MEQKRPADGRHDAQAECGSTRDLAGSAPEAALPAGRTDSLHAFLAALSDPVLVFSLDGLVLFTNRAAQECLGYTAAELLGGRLQTLHPPEASDQVTALVAGVSAGGVTTWAIPLLSKAGIRIPVETHLTRVGWGGQAALISISRDMTEWRRSEEALRQSEERLRATLESTPNVAVQWYDADGRVVFWNRASERAYGWTAEEASGKTLDRLIWSPEDAAAFRHVLAEIRRTGTTHGPAEYDFRRRDGSTGTCLSTVFMLPMPASSPCFVCMDVDISRRRQTEEALHRNRNMLAHVLDSVPQGIFWKDIDGFYLGCNGVFARAIGMDSPAQVEGKTDYDMPWSRAEADAYRADDQEVILSNQPKRHIVEPLRQADGTCVWIDTTKVPLTDKSGNVHGILGVYDDVTERRAAEEAVRQQLAFDAFFTGMLVRFASCAGDEIDSRMRHSLQELGHFAQVEVVFVALLAPDQATWTVAYEWCAEGYAGFGRRYRDVPLGTLPWTEKTLLGGSAMQLDTLDVMPVEAEAERQRFMRDGTRSLLIVPLSGCGGLVSGGLGLVVGSRRVEWSADDIRRLRMVSDALANVLERQRAEATLARRNRELALLNRLMAAAATDMAPDALLGLACRELAVAFGLSQASAGLVAEDRAAIRIVAEFVGPGRPSALGITFPVGSAFARLLLVDRRPLVALDAAADPRLDDVRELVRTRQVVSCLMLPLVIDGEGGGGLFLTATERRRFSDEEVNLASAVAGQLAAALGRARLSQMRKRLMTAITQTPESIVITDSQARILYVNPAFEQISGYSQAEAMGQNPRLLKSGRHDAAFYRDLWATIGNGGVWRGRLLNKRKDGSLYTEDAVIAPVRDEHGAIVEYIGVKRDITHELAVEEQYRQAQKMESIGRLAGGLAHDFNNLLSVIIGHAELALRELPDAAPGRADLGSILGAAQRAAGLTGQLLAFSRRQVVEPRVLDLNELTLDVKKLLRRVISEDIRVVKELAPDLGRVRADAGQIEQVLLNLVVNARDAMPSGGTLTLRTANVTLDDEYARRHFGVTPGEYIVLSVADTGTGMTEEVKQHLFEPFFTTKPQGQGTGLGLATCFGIVQQSRGHIRVDSEVGKGTTVSVHLPRVQGRAADSGSRPAAAGAARGTETVLLVEDDVPLRSVMARVLHLHGYTVLDAAHGDDALAMVRASHCGVDLLLTDVVMPDTGGDALAARVRGLCPRIKVLFVSGYTGDALVREALASPGVHFLQKPFSPADLANKVRATLDGV